MLVCEEKKRGCILVIDGDDVNVGDTFGKDGIKVLDVSRDLSRAGRAALPEVVCSAGSLESFLGKLDVRESPRDTDNDDLAWCVIEVYVGVCAGERRANA
jgi:hypothetical protein